MKFLSPSIRARAVLGACVFGTLSAATVALGFWVRPDLLMVEQVRFVGNGQATAAELRHLAELPNGTRIWEVEAERIAAGVERHPWVRQAEVRQVFPDAVEVKVEEYAPVALLHFGELYYVAADGTVFLEADGDDLDHPSITGIQPDLEKRHPELPRLVVADALRLLDTLDERGLVSRDLVDEVRFDAARGFTVRTRGSRVLFALGGLDEQVDRFAQLIASGTVDLDRAFHVDLGPRSVAIVRPLGAPGEG